MSDVVAIIILERDIVHTLVTSGARGAVSDWLL